PPLSSTASAIPVALNCLPTTLDPGALLRLLLLLELDQLDRRSVSALFDLQSVVYRMEALPGGARAASGDESESGRHDGQQAASETPQDVTPNSNRAAGNARSMDLEDEEANSEENVVPSMACHLLPHGLYVFLPASVALMAWLATLSKDDCDYAKVTGDIVAEITGSPGAIAWINTFFAFFWLTPRSATILSEVPFVEVGFDHWRGPEHNGETDEWSINIAEPSGTLDFASVLRRNSQAEARF
ncbi:hypothetical protein THAOC_16057, partial [Thalassiosira oceanica]